MRRIVSFPLTLRIDAQMAPLMRLLVYYVREGGETIADSIEVKVEASTQNKVSGYFPVPTCTHNCICFVDAFVPPLQSTTPKTPS